MLRRMFTIQAAALLSILVAGLTGCGHPSSSTNSAQPVTLRLGYLTRITHASALVGIDRGLFAKNLGPDVNLDVKAFGQGTEEATALLSGQIDAAYVGPNPAFNAWQKSGGTAIKIISGQQPAERLSSSNRISGQPKTCAARRWPIRPSAETRTSASGPGSRRTA